MLVGKEFAAAAAALGVAWEAALATESVHLVVLRGGTGAGKTRLLQSLYEQVMALSDAPEYPDGLPLDPRGLPHHPPQDPTQDQHGAQHGTARVRYWPPTLHTPPQPPARGTSGAPFVTAATPTWGPVDSEVLYPDGAWVPPAGSRLRVFWWGLRGHSGGCAALVGSAQIAEHLTGLREAIEAGDQLTRNRART